MADDRIRETEQFIGYAALVHQVSGKGKTRDTEQGKGIHAGEKALCKLDDRHAGSEEVNQRGDSQAESNRDSHEQADDECDK